MSSKTFVVFAMFVGSTIGEFIPSFFGAGMLSMWGIVGSGIGGIIGLLIGLKITEG